VCELVTWSESAEGIGEVECQGHVVPLGKKEGGRIRGGGSEDKRIDSGISLFKPKAVSEKCKERRSEKWGRKGPCKFVTGAGKSKYVETHLAS